MNRVECNEAIQSLRDIIQREEEYLKSLAAKANRRMVFLDFLYM